MFGRKRVADLQSRLAVLEQEHQALQRELRLAQTQLAERKLVDRARGY